MWRQLGALQQPLLGLAEKTLSRWKPAPKPVVLPKGFDPIPPTPTAELDRILAALRAKQQAWVDLPAKERAILLRQCITTTLQVTEEAAAAAVSAKGSYGSGLGEELLTWVPVVSALREYAEALEAGGSPPVQAIKKRENGQFVADVFPLGLLEGLLYGGFTGEIWIEPGKEPAQGCLYREKAMGGTPASGGVGLVLGAGNQLPVAALDILHKLVVDDEVVICKMNPVNEYLGPFIRRAYQPLVDHGFLEVVYGGGDVGAHLCKHEAVKTVHLTGSAATYDAIVWGEEPKTGDPPLKKFVGAELGCVTPYIVVPGPWSEVDIEYHAETVAAALVNNAGHNCLKAELIVTDRAWPLREHFVEALRRHLAIQPNRVAYYPHSDKKHAAFMQKFPDAEQLGPGSMTADGAVLASAGSHVDIKTTPWLLKAGLSPDEAATQDENWCGVLQEVALPGCGDDAAKFMAAATEFANDKCWGTLSCGVVIHPKTQRSAAAAYHQMLADLRYGSIAVNCPSLMCFATTKLPWGAFPGGTPKDIGSGNCFVHNTYLFDNVQKGILYAPWHFHPHPFWAPSNRNAEEVARGALRFCAAPSLIHMLPLAGSAVKG